MATQKQDLVDIGEALGIPIKMELTEPLMIKRLKQGPARPKSTWAQLVSAVAAIFAVIIACGSAVFAVKTAYTSEQNDYDKTIQLDQSVVIYEFLEQEAKSKIKLVSFDDLKTRYEKEVKRDGAWGPKLQKEPFDANRLKLLLMNLVSLKMVEVIYPGPKYTINQGLQNKNLDRVDYVQDAKNDIITKVFESNGKETLETLKTQFKVIKDTDGTERRRITDTEWAILLTELVSQGFIRVGADSKVWTVVDGNLYYQRIPDGAESKVDPKNGPDPKHK